MRVTIRELNAFGNILEHTEHKALCRKVHEQVLKMVESGQTELDMRVESSEDKILYELIKDAEIALRQQKMQKMLERYRRRIK